MIRFIGVRHHSPACARLVDWAVTTLRPRLVLIEGPADMNDRLGELLLEHEPPIALYTYRLDGGPGGDGDGDGGMDDDVNDDGDGVDAAGDGKVISRGTWTPFCAYSPEWVALRRGAAVGAEVRFIDLPAWHDAFRDVPNRFADGHVRHSHRLGEVADRLGFESTDALWDHLFEQPLPPEELLERLDRYFVMLRADEPATPDDAAREEAMARAIAWAAERVAPDEHIVVVTGGYHQPWLAQHHAAHEPAAPVATVPEGSRVGSYLVPYSFHRLDAFTGYASGMPSPAWYQAVWDHGLDGAPDEMLLGALAHLRARGQIASSADAVAARALAEGLRRLRDHPAVTRADLLDGLAGALLKEAIDGPLPWTRRGTLARGTHPWLVEIVRLFSGERTGTLDPRTPRPPLVGDVERELARVALVLPAVTTELSLDVLAEADQARRTVLVRLALLDIPGVRRIARARLDRRERDPHETWELERLLETDAALIERAVYGATLAEAARARLRERLGAGRGARDLAAALEDAWEAGFLDLAQAWAAELGALVDVEPQLGALGEALARLDELARAAVGLVPLARRAIDRGLWLLEGVRGRAAPFASEDVAAIVALREALANHGEPAQRTAALEVFARRAQDPEAPPAVRGACLGARVSLPASPGAPTAPVPPGAPAVPPGGPTDEEIAAAVRRTGRPAEVGDFLAGLFVLAREHVGAPLVRAVHELVVGYDREDFLVALPPLRQAFEFFPPRERVRLAGWVVAVGGGGALEAPALLEATVDPAALRAGADLDARLVATARRHGLWDG